MKNSTLFIVIVLFLAFLSYSQRTFSQDIAQSNYIKSRSANHNLSNRIVIKNAILEDGKYTYKFKQRDILVEIKGGFYYEYHPKKEYIKAKIDWLSEYEYQLTIVDMEKRGVPFKIGSQLTATVTKIDGDEYFYTSTLNNKTGSGSFKKVK